MTNISSLALQVFVAQQGGDSKWATARFEVVEGRIKATLYGGLGEPPELRVSDFRVYPLGDAEGVMAQGELPHSHWAQARWGLQEEAVLSALRRIQRAQALIKQIEENEPQAAADAELARNLLG